MRASPGSSRIWRAAVAGALMSAALMVLVIALGVPVLQVFLQWRARGMVGVAPSAPRAAAVARSAVVEGADPQEAAVIQHALADLVYPVPLERTPIIVVDEPCPDCSGEYVPGLNVIRVARSTVDAGGLGLQRTLAHEIGHLFDMEYMTDRQRARYRLIRDIPARLSWEAGNVVWARRPVEDFAEVFATLDMPLAISAPMTVYGPVHHSGQIAALYKQANLTDPPGLAADPGQMARLDVEYLASLATDPAFFMPAVVTIVLGGLLGAALGAWREWRG